MSTPASPELTSLVQRNPAITFAAFDDEWLAIDGEAGYCYSLNAIAGEIWDLIEAPAAIALVCAELAPRYAVEPATLQADILALLQQLHGYGLVRFIEPSG